jgi:hypothetical protein
MAKTGVNRDEADVFLSEIARHGSIRKACRVAGVTRSWLRLKQQDEEFAQAYADAQDDSVDRIEDQARDEALDGNDKLIIYLLDQKRYKKQSTGDLSGIQPSVTITIGG